jgi:hypothetical protein
MLGFSWRFEAKSLPCLGLSVFANKIIKLNLNTKIDLIFNNNC